MIGRRGEIYMQMEAIRLPDVQAVPSQFAELSRNFRIAYAPFEGSRDLVVVLSSNQLPAFTRWRFRHNALSIADIDQLYYLTRTAELLRAIESFAEGFARVVFIGASKGGFGALLIAALSAARRRDRMWCALAFSPQTRLAPDSSCMHFPSARRVLDEAAKSPWLQRRVDAFGDAARLLALPNVQATIVYGMLNAADTEAAHALVLPNVRLYPLPFVMHNTMFPFVLRGRGVEVMHRRLAAMYQTEDADMLATRPLDPRQLAEDVCRATWVPGLNDLVEEVLAAGGPGAPDRIAAPLS